MREKLSLCYYCAARYDKYKGIIIVDSGIEAKNYQKAKDEILRQLEDIKNGGLTEEELANAVRYIKNSYNSIFDSTKAAESFYLGQIFSETDNDPEEVLAQIDKITLEDIKNAMQTVKLDTIYLLAGEEVEL